MNALPALLGGQPIFDQKVPMVRPVLPDFTELTEGIQKILETGMVTKGPYLELFEQAVAEHLGVRHAVAVSSCTSGLMLVYRSLQLSGEVVVPSFTFMATVSALVWNGLRPVFTDVRRETTNLSPEAAEAAITPETTAIVGVHNFGNPAEIEALQRVASRRGLKLIFDAAHGFGARYRGMPIGAQGDAQVFSLSPTKLLISGEGGIVATNDDELAQNVRMGREYGNNGYYDSTFPGLNARMPEINALMGLQSLQHLEDAAVSRNETASLFHETLGRLPGIGFQEVHPGDRNSYREFSVTINAQDLGLARDALVPALAAENIDARKYYQPPVHRQTAYKPFYNNQQLPNTEWLAENSLSLPMWSHMPEEVALGISTAFERIHENARSIRDKLAR
ncbi:MAG TPA: DegT/DnrJ/EryC1/StrS family aminotransferase [Anaerolineales bacterium]|nr:DegT/DnrJ/EryC1/StrS family aminotransferase [Anaerolineales bacterium]